MKIETDNFERVDHVDGGFIFRFKYGKGPAGNICKSSGYEKEGTKGKFVIMEFNSGWCFLRELSEIESLEFSKLLK